MTTHPMRPVTGGRSRARPHYRLPSCSPPTPAPGTHHLTFAGHDGGRFRAEAEYELEVR
ncbi:hypothetical protein [Micromonospora aurantiaca (nom. illeg.)]|uniref:hypothetical protein n=1 Tax=Micromonospora aurantiaca (nom. illeg.) TaxID=47850 RepID=UPI0001C4767C